MKLNVIDNRIKFFIISSILILLSIFLLLFTKLNLWIDMTWWTNAEYSYSNNINIEKLRKDLDNESNKLIYNNKKVINDINVYKISWEKKINVTTWFNKITLSSLKWESKSDKEKRESQKLEEFKKEFKKIILETIKKQDKTASEYSYTNIWKSFWDYIKNTAILTLVIAIFWIAFYVTWAFSWVASGISILSFSTITILTLFHDIIISTWLYILTWNFFSEYKVDTFLITALLTILWYSINDTIVVFDRIRSNLKKLVKKKDLKEIIEISVSETLRRSIFTSLTVFFVLLTVFFFGPKSISWFILAMLFGTVIGTYSSIFIASPLLYEFNKYKKLSEYKEKIIRPEDKIVV